MTTLSNAPAGLARCVSIDGHGPESVRLKRMGICSGRTIEVVQTGDPMILSVVGSRVGLSRQLARRVVVDCLSGAAEQACEAVVGG